MTLAMRSRWWIPGFVLMASWACTPESDARSLEDEAQKTDREPVLRTAGEEGGIVARGIGPAGPLERLVAAADPQVAPGNEEEDEELRWEKYWNEIEFTWVQFDEVLDLVRTEYIEKDIDTRRAYVSAANFALAMLDPTYEVVPASYHKAHKDDPDVVLGAGDREELVLRRRDALREQQRLLQEAWDQVPFGKPELQRIIDFASSKAKKMKEPLSEDRLLISAAQGFLYALDPHSSLMSERAWDESTEKTRDSSFDGIGALLTQRWEPSSDLKNRLRGRPHRLKEADTFLLVELSEEDKFTQKTFVESPIQGQPAELAGLWAGDEILAVDGRSVEGMDLTKVVSRIRGPRGTQVRLT
ncbi:MAG: PDZ domain-containing protein, partial [Deltaproteobacteria bacterium]|nr:PDZ domain-containing protein [Deltaproteobacteria bacterium]